MTRKKQITTIKMRNKLNIKIKFNGDEIEK